MTSVMGQRPRWHPTPRAPARMFAGCRAGKAEGQARPRRGGAQHRAAVRRAGSALRLIHGPGSRWAPSRASRPGRWVSRSD